MKKNSLKLALKLSIVTLFTIQCTHTSGYNSGATTPRNPTQVAERDLTPAERAAEDALQNSAQPESAVVQHGASAQQNSFSSSGDWVLDLPGDDGKEYLEDLKPILRNKKFKLTEALVEAYAARFAKYIGFLMYKTTDNAAEREKLVEKQISRLFGSANQFLFCKDLNDLKCLETPSGIQPTVIHRQEDPKLKLGEMKIIDDALEPKMEAFFNKQIFVPESEYDQSKGVVQELKKAIDSVPAKKGNAIYMAIYGMDDITDTPFSAGSKLASLSPIYNAIVAKHKAKLDIFAVLDQKGPHPALDDEQPLIFSYVKPSKAIEAKNWIFSPSINPVLYQEKGVKEKREVSGHTNLTFQYNGGTQGILTELNRGIASNATAKARVEWKNDGIMHNKYFIFQNGKNKSLWTGTANISRTCLGTERNSNMSVLIKDNSIAQIFLDEFNEMYNYKETDPKAVMKATMTGPGGKPFPFGRFHKEKRPNTNRLLYYKKDNTTARIYFSPTDDGEHRGILPMLHSAGPGDRLVISMFGAGGIEYVRALQLASARGAKVDIILDTPTACGPGSWLGTSGDATLLENNPFKGIYGKVAPIDLRLNENDKEGVWKQNHQKIGLFLKYNPDTNKHFTRHFAFGSQNWSASGNDKNDENMMILSRDSNDLKIAVQFQDHFDNFLWPKSKIVSPTGCKGSGEDDDETEKEDD